METSKELSAGPVDRVVNKAAAAVFFEVSLPTIDGWLRRGCPYVQRGSKGRSWKLDLLDVAKWYFGAPIDLEVDPEKMSPKDRLDYVKGTRELDALAKDRAELIPFELLDQILGAAFSEIRGGLLSQHNSIASQYPEIPADAIRWILEANRELLARLAQTRLPRSVESALDKLDGKSSAAAEPECEPMG